MSDEDLASVIAYVKSVPAVDAVTPAKSIGPLSRVLYLATDFPLIPAEELPHGAPRAPAVPHGVTREYGSYLATIGGCKSCHLPELNGGVPREGGMAAPISPRRESENGRKRISARLFAAVSGRTGACSAR